MLLNIQLLEERVVLDAAGGAELLQTVGEWSAPVGGEAASSLESSQPETYQIETGKEPPEFPLYSKLREFRANGPQLYLEVSEVNTMMLENSNLDLENRKVEIVEYQVVEIQDSVYPTHHPHSNSTAGSISLQILDLDVEFSFSSSFFDSNTSEKGVLPLQSIEPSPLELFDSTAYNSSLFGEEEEPSSVDYRETSSLMKGFQDEGIRTDSYYYQRVPGLFLSIVDLEEEGEWEGELLLSLEESPMEGSTGSYPSETQISFHQAAHLLREYSSPNH